MKPNPTIFTFTVLAAMPGTTSELAETIGHKGGDSAVRQAAETLVSEGLASKRAVSEGGRRCIIYNMTPGGMAFLRSTMTNLRRAIG